MGEGLKIFTLPVPKTSHTTPLSMCTPICWSTGSNRDKNKDYLHSFIFFSRYRKSETHQQLEAVVPVRRVDGKIRMESERRQSVLVVSDSHARLGPRQPSFGHPKPLEPVDVGLTLWPLIEQS